MARMLSLLVCLFLLSACVPAYQTDYKMVEPATERGKLCVMKCIQSRAICNRYCKAPSQSLCEHDERDRAQAKYELYVKEMKAKQKPIFKTVDSFVDPSYCRYVNRQTHDCNCDAEFRACYKICGGKVVEERTCIANCI